jgi:hypothetical protein
MFNRKISILLMLLICICTLSAVSAADNATDTVTIGEATTEDMVAADNIQDDLKENDIENEDKLAVETDEAAVSQDQNDDTLSLYGLTADFYTIQLNQNNQISGPNGGRISYYMAPCQNQYFYAYGYYLNVYNGNNALVYTSGLFMGDSPRTAGNFVYDFPKNALDPGQYVIAAVDYWDNKAMSSGYLTVTGTATITSADYTSTYNSGALMYARFVDKNTGKALAGISAKVVFSDGKNAVTRTYTTNANGQIAFVPPLNAGRYTATISSNTGYISATPLKKSVVINKAPVTVKAYKATEYQNYKITLKATVQSNGRNVNEGTVTFNINGKSYKVAVKDGVATKKIKFGKAKTYKYTAKFNGANFVDTKAASANAVVKKQTAVKIVAKNQVLLRGAYMVQQYFPVKVLTKDGKKISGGNLQVNGEDYGKVQNGQVLIPYFGYNWNYVKSVGNTHYYKKAVSVKLTFKFVPDSHKYKTATKTIKYTVKYRCTDDAKTTSHTHSSGARYIVT